MFEDATLELNREGSETKIIETLQQRNNLNELKGFFLNLQNGMWVQFSGMFLE